MVSTKFNKSGGKVEIWPTMIGPMICAYSIDAYKPGERKAFKSQAGNIDNVQAMVFDSVDEIPEGTEVYCSFSFKAGKPVFIGNPYIFQLSAKQDGRELIGKDISDLTNTLKSDIELSDEQYGLVLFYQDVS